MRKFIFKEKMGLSNNIGAAGCSYNFVPEKEYTYDEVMSQFIDAHPERFVEVVENNIIEESEVFAKLNNKIKEEKQKIENKLTDPNTKNTFSLSQEMIDDLQKTTNVEVVENNIIEESGIVTKEDYDKLSNMKLNTEKVSIVEFPVHTDKIIDLDKYKFEEIVEEIIDEIEQPVEEIKSNSAEIAEDVNEIVNSETDLDYSTEDDEDEPQPIIDEELPKEDIDSKEVYLKDLHWQKQKKLCEKFGIKYNKETALEELKKLSIQQLLGE